MERIAMQIDRLTALKRCAKFLSDEYFRLDSLLDEQLKLFFEISLK